MRPIRLRFAIGWWSARSWRFSRSFAWARTVTVPVQRWWCGLGREAGHGELLCERERLVLFCRHCGYESEGLTLETWRLRHRQMFARAEWRRWMVTKISPRSPNTAGRFSTSRRSVGE